MLKINNLNFKNILKNINIEIKDNSIVSLIASNNSGKTLLCDILTTNVLIDSSISINGYDINKNKHHYLRRISFIPEHFFFINDFVYQEIKMPLYNLKLDGQKINNKFNMIVDLLNIKYLIEKEIKELNDYEKFLVYLSKALITDPKIIIIDDIFKILDKSYYSQVFIMLKKIKQYTSILITSIYFDPILYSDNIYYLENKTIKYSGDKEKFYKLDNELVKGHIKIDDVISSSLGLNCYQIMNEVVRDKEDLVNILW